MDSSNGKASAEYPGDPNYNNWLKIMEDSKRVVGSSGKESQDEHTEERKKLKVKESSSEAKRKKQLSKRERDAVVKRVGRILEELTEGGVELTKMGENCDDESGSRGKKQKRSCSVGQPVRSSEKNDVEEGDSDFVFHKELRCADCYGLIVDNDMKIDGSLKCSENCVRNARESAEMIKQMNASRKNPTKSLPSKLNRIPEAATDTEDVTTSKLKTAGSVENTAEFDSSEDEPKRGSEVLKSSEWPVVAKEMSEMFEKQSGQIQSYMTSIMSLFKDFLSDMSRNFSSQTSVTSNDSREKFTGFEKIYQTKPSPSSNLYNWDISCLHHLPVYGGQLSRYDFSYLTKLGDYMNCDLSLVANRSHVFLPTAMILIRTGEGTNQLARALLSSSSKGNIIHKPSIEKLKLQSGPEDDTIRTIFGSRFTSFTAHIDLRQQETAQDRTCCTMFDLILPPYVELADPVFPLPYDVDIIIGAELTAQLSQSGKFNSGDLVFQRTVLGWTVSGRVDDVDSYEFKSISNEV